MILWALFLLGLLLERRWACRNLCFMGALCASGASISRLIPVVDTQNVTFAANANQIACKNSIKDYVNNNHGLVTNSDV